MSYFSKTQNTKEKNSYFFHKLQIFLFILGLSLLIVWGCLYIYSPTDALYNYLSAYMTFLTMFFGCLIFVVIQHAVRAGWSVVIRRIPEVMSATAPLFLILFIPILAGMKYLYPWTHESHIDDILREKLPYLNTNFFILRAFLYFIIWSIMGVWFYKKSVEQDYSSDSSITKKLLFVSPMCIFLFALTISFASFDWIMSLQPHWYSTIFGLYIFAGSMLSGLCIITLIAMVLQKFNFLGKIVNVEHYHDLGKLIFGFTVFWAYIGFSQFMLIWYAALPEETEFYLHRLHGGWEYISWAMPITHFFIPFFFLLSRHVKRYKPTLAIACIWIIAMHAIDIYWLIMPVFTAFNVSIAYIVSFVGIFSLWISVFMLLLFKESIVPVGDKRLDESIKFENV